MYTLNELCDYENQFSKVKEFECKYSLAYRLNYDYRYDIYINGKRFEYVHFIKLEIGRFREDEIVLIITDIHKQIIYNEYMKDINSIYLSYNDKLILVYKKE